jgi:hypothetical protein
MINLVTNNNIFEKGALVHYEILKEFHTGEVFVNISHGHQSLGTIASSSITSTATN